MTTESLGYTGPSQAVTQWQATGEPQPAMYRWRETCRLCSAPLRRILDLGMVPLANENWPRELVSSGIKQDEFPVILGQCCSCQHVQNMCVVDPARLYSEYTYTSGVSSAFRAHLQSLATELYAAGHRTIVDIGSNDGTLLHYCRNLGMRGIGVDPARNLAAEASARGDLTIPAFFNAEIAKHIRDVFGGAPDVVTSLNSFAHSDSLGEIADGVRELIGDNGVFVFEVAYLLDLLEKNECGSLYHEHASNWHVAPLVKFFEKHDLRLDHILRLSIQGGSIRGVVVRNDARLSWNTQSVQGSIDAESSLPGLIESWPSRIASEREQLAKSIEPYRGKGLAVYGAPARFTVYAHAMGLRPSDVSCVFDDEPRKIGKFTPGLHYPIVSSDELMKLNPPAILIASWNYEAQIRAKFPDYRGAWLVPPRSA